MKIKRWVMILILLLHLNVNGVAVGEVFFNPEFPDVNKTYVPEIDVGFMKLYNVSSQWNSREFTFTFDDGPHEVLTKKLLDLLKLNQIKATFFVLTELITPKTEFLIKRMYKEGHLVGVHGLDHTNTNYLNAQVFKKNVRAAFLKLKKIQDQIGIHQKEIYYRFPYGDYGHHPAYHQMEALKTLSHELFNENCINFVFWNIDTADWVPTMSPSQITQTVVAHFDGGVAYMHEKKNGKWVPGAYEIISPPNGGVTLMHDIHPQSVAAVPFILQALKKRDITIVPLNHIKEFNFDEKRCEFLSTK